jgi:hypothetical protein
MTPPLTSSEEFGEMGRREAGARRALAEATVPVATVALRPAQRPNEAIWAPICYDGRRMRLAELAGCRTRQSPTGGSKRPPSIGAISTISGGGITPIVTARRDHSSRS